MEIIYDGNEQISFVDLQYGRIEIRNTNEVLIKEQPLEYQDAPVMDIRKGKLN
jgi:hypothetical protein